MTPKIRPSLINHSLLIIQDQLEIIPFCELRVRNGNLLMLTQIVLLLLKIYKPMIHEYSFYLFILSLQKVFT